MTKVYVDGAYGTVAIELKGHLLRLCENGVISEIIEIPYEKSKDVNYRAGAMAAADIVILCLPEDQVKFAVQIVERVNPHARIIDTSTEYRVNRNWIYGMPELEGMPQIIKNAHRVANPGCLATGCVLLSKAIAYAMSFLGKEEPYPKVNFFGLAGYSAAGKHATKKDHYPQLTQMGQSHKHLPEIARYGLVDPSLTAMIGDWERGMLVQTTVDIEDTYRLCAILERLYSRHRNISVELAPDDCSKLSVKSCNFTNNVKILVTPQPNKTTTLAIAYDNLGKGSAGAVAQNLKIMLGYVD